MKIRPWSAEKNGVGREPEVGGGGGGVELSKLAEIKWVEIFKLALQNLINFYCSLELWHS